MNKAYKIIWSHVRNCYVVVSEITKNHGKNNTRSIVSQLAARSAEAQRCAAAGRLLTAAGRWALPFVTAGVLLAPVSGFASTIKDADNNSLTSNGKVHNIYTQKILSNERVNFGYNRFQKFEITKGDIANMHFHLQGQPANKSDNLVNLVKSKIDIQGTVNAIKDNRIGGNLYFISPEGMTVGPTGVINTGRFVGLVPSIENFAGKARTSGMWGSTTQMAYQFEHYISNFGKRNDKGEFSVLRREWAAQEELEGFKLASDGKIEIAGQVNTRSGILLGAAHIDIKNGALLRGNKNIDFTSLVNAKDDGGTVVTNATLSGVGMTAVADDKSGDIILRAATEHDNTFLYSPTIETIINTSLDARVDVDGAIETDGRADISASATHKFDSSKFTLTKPAMDAGKDLLRDLLGLQIDAAGARKLTTAQVNLTKNGKITAAGDVNLQADASTTIKLEAKIRPAKAADTTSAMPVAAATVGIVKNKALVDVKGDITSTAGDVALAANAKTNASLKTVALEPYTAYVSPGDKGNAIYVGVSWLDGDNLAQINIDEGKNAITAKGGDFSAEAHATSDLSAGSYVEGADKTFASTSVTVLDFDTATNVNIKRSVEAKSVKAAAENEIAGLSASAEDANGEGEGAYIDFVLLNPTKGDELAKKLKDKYHWNGFVNGGKLEGLENAFDTVQGYITAGAAVAVVDSVNSAAVTVAPGVTLKATGDAVKKDASGKDVPGGDVTLEANAHIDSLHHAIAGWANEQDADTASKVTVASAFLYSNIENDAKVELQKAAADQNGASLISEKGSVNLNATGKQLYDAAEPAKNVVDRAKKMWGVLKNFANQFPELANLESDTVKVEKLLDGKLKTETDRASFWDFCDSLKNFLKNEGKNISKLNSEAKQMVRDLSDVLSPGSYTNYYVRSYMVDSQDSGSANLDVAASVNIAKLHNKGIVSLGEKANISAGKNIKIDTLADTDVVTATGYGGEFFAMSESNGNAAGATVAVQDFIGDSLILSGKNVTLTANTAGEDSGNIALNAKNEMIQTGIILSAGKADKNLSATGSLSLLTGGVNTLVLLDDETAVRAAGTFSMGADSSATVTNVVGGLALGSARTNATIGAGVAVNLLDVNSIAMIGDTGSDASTTVTDTETDEFKKKSIEEQNKIKAENALAKARKVAAKEAQTKKMGADFSLTTEELASSLGVKTADGAAKGSVTAQNVSVTGNSGGTLNAIGIEGAEASESHSGFDFLTNWDKKGNYLRDQMTDAGINVVGFPFDRFKKILNKDVQLKKTWDFSTYQPVQPANDNASEASFNATAAASVAWNKVESETAAVISGVNVNLRKQKDADKAGSLINTATDDVFSGAWAGAAAVNWFNGATGAAANNNAKKGALGTAIAVNRLDRNADAVMLASNISQAGNIKNTAIRNGAEVAAALGLAVTNDSQGTSTDASVAFGLAMNKANTGARALLVDTTSRYETQADNITYTGGTDLETSAYDGDIQVAGGVDLAWVKTDQAGTGIAAGMTAAVSEISNDIQSGIQGGSYTGLSNVLAAGEDALTQVNAAVGLGFTRSDKGVATAGSLAYTELKNTNHSYISGTETLKATGGVTVTSQDISGKKENQYKKYLKDRKVDATGLGYLSSDTTNKLGTGTAAGSTMVNVAVEFSEGKTNAAGAALSINNVTNKFSSDIVNNKALEAGSVKAAADVHTNIVSVAAGVSVSEADWGGVGSLSFNELDQDNIVSITGNRNGTAANSGITADSVSAAAKNTSHIVNVTGDFAGGKNAVGLGIAYNRMDDTTGIYATNNQIQAKDAAKGVAVSLDANNDAYALALSVGAAATYKDNGTVAAHGNFAVNRGHNDTVAVIGEDKDGKKGTEKDKIGNASSVTVKATDKTSKTTIAGSAELAIKDTTVALGVGVALTESDKGSEKGDGKETVRAEINNADITTVKAGDKAPVINATATDSSKATTVSVGVGLVKSAKFAAQGVGADANINKTITAGLKDTSIDKNGGSKAALVTVKADTSSTLKTGAAAMQLSGPDSFLAGVVAVGVNRIKDTTTAGVTYTDKQTAASMNVGNLDISAASKGEILSVAMGASVAVKGTAAVGGSGSHNYIENNATAEIKKANINSTGNVGVVAQSDEAISNYAGMLDVAAGGQGAAAALGVTGSYNKLTGHTYARIEDSTVVAKGSDSNQIMTASALKDNTDNDKYLIDSAVSRNTWSSGSFTEGEGDDKKYGVSRLQKGRKEETKSGVVVDASATHSIASVMANGGVAVGMGDSGVGVSLAGVVNLNYVSGETAAKVVDSKLNTAQTRSDVNVHAADYTNVAEFSGAASVGVGQSAGIAAGFTGTTNEIDRVTAAGITTASATWDKDKKQYAINDTSKTKNTVYANNFAVTADAKQAMSAFNVTGAVAGSSVFSFETGDNVNTNKLQSAIVAAVTNATVDYAKDAVVKASHEDAVYNLNVDAGLAISAKGAGSLNVGVGVVNESSSVTADVENSSIKKQTGAAGKSKLSIGASNSTKLEATLTSVGVAAGLFSGAIASSVAVNNVDTRVTSRIAGSELTADTVTVDTTNALKVKDATGTGAGALLGGIGVGVDVNTFNDTVTTTVDNSTVKADDTLTVNTQTQREINNTVVGVGVGAGGIAVNVLAVTVNEGVEELGVVKDKDSKGNEQTFDHSATINKVLKTVNDNNQRDLSASFYGMTETEKTEMEKKARTNVKAGTTLAGTGVHTYVQNSSTLEAEKGALTVTNTELNDADLVGGSGSGGIAGVNVADVVYHLNELNEISVANSTVKGGSVSLTTHQGNVTKNKDDAIHLQTVQAGLGGLAIGVGYAGLTTEGQTGITIDKGTLTATNGDLTVKSSDDAKSKTDMTGVSVGAVSVPVSVAHNTNIANNFVNVKGGSQLTASTTKTQEVTDSEGNKKTEKAPAYINLQTERAGRVAAKTVGVGVGGAAVIVNTAKVYDRSSSAVSVADGSNTFTADAIRMEAVNAPVVKAEAGGTGVSALGVSVMQSNAEAYSAATVTVADNNSLLGDAVLAQAVIGKEGTDLTHAETHSTNVSIIANVSPNKAKAITQTEAKVSMGTETFKTEKKEKTTNGQGQEEEKTVTGSYTSLALITRNNASRRAILGNTSISGGFSIGTGDAKAEGDDKSIVEAKGANTGGDAAVKLQNLKISAGGSNTAKGLADGDSGGFTAWGAAATITMNTKTTNTASLSGAWNVAGNADIGALQQVTSKGSSKTGAGGAFTATWANSDNNVEMDTKTELKEGAQLTAGQSYVLASNKIVTGAYDGESWNNHMSVGGIIQIAPDIKSKQVLTSKANVAINKNAKVTTAKGQVYDAYSNLDVYNKVEGKGGGVAENVFAYSDNTVVSTNKIAVDEGAELNQKGEYEAGSDITLSSSDKIKMDLAAEAYIGGAGGALEGGVENRVTRNNGVEVNGKLASTHDINLYAGVDADGSASDVNITELAEAHNNTLVSVYTGTDTNLDLKNNQQVIVGKNGSATSVRHINVSAENGSETFKKESVKVYNLVAGQSKNSKTVGNAPGMASMTETNNNFVNVEGLLKTGIQNNVKIEITGALVPSVTSKDENGNAVEHTLTPVNGELPKFNIAVTNNSGTNTDTIVRKEDIKTGDMDYATQLGKQLAALESLISDYNNGKSSNTAAYLGYIQQRQRILDEMEKRHLFTEATNDNGEKVKVYINEGFTISYVEIPEITVSGGNIVVQSDNLYGKGKLEANGAPQIQINNLSNAYLKLDGLKVGENGGEIRFQGHSISAGDEGKKQINDLNKDKGKKAEFSSLYSDSSTSSVSAISVLNNNEAIRTEIQVKDQNGKEVTYVSIPDVAVLGDITNTFGDVRIENKQGNITIGSGSTNNGANINGRMVQLLATQGSISQDYIDGIVNIGGRPQDINRDEVDKVIKDTTLSENDKVTKLGLTEVKSNIEKAEAGRIAGDSIYIAAADINVNGLIQSGYGKYVADIAADAVSDENIQKLKNNGSEVTVQGRTMYKLNDGNRVEFDKDSGAFQYVVQVYYDPQSKGLVVEDIDTKGGKIYLTGRISSTGNGRILAVDGGAEITIANNSKADLTTGKILNNDIEGKITITDLARDTWTEYTRSQTTTIVDYTKHLKDAGGIDQYKESGAAIGRFDKDNPKTYTPKSGLRYNWTLGKETSTTRYYEQVQNTLFWGGVETGTDTSKLAQTEASTTPTETKTTDGHALGSGNFIDTISAGYTDSSGKKLVDTEFGAIMESNKTSESRTVTGNWKEGGKWWALWSNPKYHTTWTTKTGTTQSYTFSLKADNPIGIGFIGKENGSITVSNTNTAGGNVNLNGNIQSNTKEAAVTIRSAGGSIIQKSGTTITTGKAVLQAKDDIENIHIASMGERIDTGEKDAKGNVIYTTNDGVLLNAVSSNAGNINVEVVGGSIAGQALPGNVVIQKLKSEGTGVTGSPGDVTLKAKGNITQEGTGVTVRGQSIRLTSVDGAIGTSAQSIVVDSSAEAFGLGEDSAGVNAEAKANINIAEQDGDMRVGSVISHEGDVYLEAKDGRLLDALPQTNDGNNMDEDDLIHHWIDAGLIAGTEDYEGAYIRGLKQDAANYKARVEEQFKEFKSGNNGFSLRQRFTKPGTTETYANAKEYLAQDKTYMVMENANADYKAYIEKEYANKEGKPELEAKYAGYDSAAAYLAQDTGYQNMLSIARDYKDETEKDFAQFTVEASIKQKFTKTDGTFYASVSEYLAADTAYQKLVKETQDKTNPYVRDVNEQFNKFKNGDNTYKDMFTKEDGTTYDTVSQYLLEDATYQGYIKDQNDYSVRICDEFSHFTNNKSNGALADMFTLPSGKTYDSAEAYLRDDATYQAMVKKYEQPEFAWTKDQLLYAIRNAIVNKETGVSSETQTKVANVQGKNVTLVAKGVGLNTNQTTEIKASDLGGGAEASIAKMKQLANADAADVTMYNKNGDILRLVTVKSDTGALVNTWKAYKADKPSEEIHYTDASNYEIDKFVIGNFSPLGVYATGKLDVTAISDNVFIAGRSNDKAGFAPVNIGKITAGGSDDTGNVNSDVRLYTREGIYNAADRLGQNEGNIHAKDLIAYGGTKDIGSKEKPVTVSLSGDLLTANAGDSSSTDTASGNVYIKNVKTDDKLRVGAIYAKNTISLESAKGFDMTTNPDYKLAYLNAGKALELKTNPSTGVIGSEANPIRILNNAGTPEQYGGDLANNGMLINLTGKDAYVKGVNGTRGDNTTMRLGLVKMTGDLAATSESYLEAGAVRLGDTEEEGINGKVDAGGNVKLEAVKDVVVTGPASSTDGDITVKAGADARVNYALTAYSGIYITAENEAKINGDLTAKATDNTVVSVSGKNGVTLDNSVISGRPQKDAEGSYRDGGAILLASANGRIRQNENGALVAHIVKAASGKAIDLTNQGNKFREFTATGVDSEETDEQGNKVKVINGGVNVSAHAGNTLTAGIENSVVYGNVALTNVDDGGLTVNTDIAVKKNQDSNSGNITFNQQGDILVEGALQAENSVSETSANGNVTNYKEITAENNIQIQATAANDAAKGNVALHGAVTSKTGTVTGEAGQNLTANDVDAKGNIALTAGHDIALKGGVKTADGEVSGNAGNDIMIEDTVTAPEHIVLTAGHDISESKNGGLVTDEADITVGNSAILTGGNNAFPRIIVNGIAPAGSNEPVIAGNVKIADSAASLSLNVNAEVRGVAEAENKIGALRVDSALTAGSVTLRAKEDIAQQAGITVTGQAEGLTVSAGTGVILENENNRFNMITLQGPETMKAEHEGRTYTVNAIRGDVKVKTHGGSDLIVTTIAETSPEQLLMVGNDFALENLDTDGGISAYNSIWAFGEKEGTGNITLKADGNIVNGDDTHEVTLLAARDINLLSVKGLVDNNGSLSAGNNVTLDAAKGISAGENKDDFVSAGNSVTMYTDAGDIETAGNVSAKDGDVLIRNGVLDDDGSFIAGTGKIQLGGNVEAGRNIDVKAAGGNIVMEKGNITAKQDIIVQAGGEGNINLSGLGMLTDTQVTAGNSISLTTEKGSILAGGTIKAEQGDIVARQTDGVAVGGEGSVYGIGFLGDVTAESGNVTAHVKKGIIYYSGNTKAGGDITATVSQEGDIGYGTTAGQGTVEAGGNVTAFTQNGNILYDNTVTAGRDITAMTLEGDVTGSGSMNAGRDVVLGSSQGDVAMQADVTAKNDVTATATQGDIVMAGNVTAKNGDVILVASNSNPETSDGNVTVKGRIKSGTDTKLIAENGNVSVAGTIDSGNDMNATVKGTAGGSIELGGDVKAIRDIVAEIKDPVNGNITVNGKTDAGRDVKVTNTEGDITLNGDVDAGNDILATTTSGMIQMDGDVTAKQGDIKAASGTGAIGLVGDIDACRDVIAKTGGTGSILFNSDWSDGKHDVHAGRDVDLTVENADISVNGMVTADAGDIRATAKTGGIDFNGSVQAGQDITASVTENGTIRYSGAVKANRDVTATTLNGTIDYAKKVEAGRSVTALTDNGNVTYNASIVAGDSVLADVLKGDIYVGDDITAQNHVTLTDGEGKITVGDTINTTAGNVTLTAIEGTVTVGEADGTGRIDAGGIVTINASKAIATDTNLVDILTSVESRNADVSVKSVNGNIHIGNNNDPDTETVTAKGNVNLEADYGKIIIDGKTSTKEGDIILKATNKEYKPGADGQNIIIHQSGKLEAGRDANLIAVNGDLHVTDNVTAQRTLRAETRGQGDITLDKDVTVVKDMTMQTEKGNITVGKDITAKNGNVTINAKSGSVAVGTVDGSGNKSGKVEAGGNVTINAAQPSAGTNNLVDILTSVESKNADVSVKTVNGDIHIGSNDANTETVTAKGNVTLEADNGKIIIDGKTSTKEGDITLKATNKKEYKPGEDGKNIIINQDGKLEAGRDANLIAVNGDLHVTDNVTAQRTLRAETRGQGAISLDENVTVVKDMVMQAEKGDITVGHKVDASQGSVTMTTGTGSIDIGSTVTAGRDISAKAGTAANGSGDILIGDNLDADTVKAGNNVTLETTNGKIDIKGSTSTVSGDIKVTAGRPVYNPDSDTIVFDQNGKLKSGKDAYLIAKNGDLHVTDDVTAKGTFYAQVEGMGNVYLDENLNVEKDLTLSTETGDITVGKEVNAGNGSVSLTTGTGNVTVGEDVTAGKNVSVTTGTGNVTVGSNGKGSVTADKDVTVNVGKGEVDIVKSVTSNDGSVTVKSGEGNIHIGNNGPTVDTVTAKENITLETGEGKITIDGKTSTQTGDVTLQAANKEYVAGETGKNIIINATGQVTAGNDANLIAKNGDLHVTDRVTAQGSLNAETQTKGDISLDDDVTVVNDISMKTQTGDITVGKKVTADNGSVSMTTETGKITVDENVTAGADVNMTTGTGNIDIGEAVNAGGSITGKSGSGTIHIGNNGPDVDTVTATENIKLEAEDGKIEIYGKTSTQTGDITLKAANKKYVPGADGQNIIIDHNGQVASGRDASLIAKNGDLHVTDAIKAQRDVNAITQSQGDVFLDDSLKVNRNATLQADTGDIMAPKSLTAGNNATLTTKQGNITSGSVTAGNNITATNGNGVTRANSLTAGNHITVANGDGQIRLGTTDSKSASLSNAGKDGSVTAGTIRVEANGNANGTGADDLHLGGSNVSAGTVVNKSSGSAPLTITTQGATKSQPMKDFNIGARNADGSYNGGIQSASGAVVQQLWTDKGLVYMNGDSNLHVSKLVVNDKLHAANQNISAGIFGRPPTHDGERVVYWNNSNRNNPAGEMSRWYSGSYSDSGWMYLDLFYNGNIGSRYGVLVDAHGYRNLYGDSISVVDTMRKRLNAEANGDGVVYYNRSNLIRFGDDANIANALAEELTVDE
ncbi:MAG: hypothetical protein J5906_09360 [Acidaminococcaceae bacterium]|nr:hypothetical protein [Acidaminococcaceae bacterium]